MSGRGTKTAQAGDQAKTLLEALARCAGPCGAKDIAEATGPDNKNCQQQDYRIEKEGAG
jgi:hypothetical protein